MADDAAEQFELVECLRAMYPLPSELEWSEETVTLLGALESGEPNDWSNHDRLEGIVRLQMDHLPALVIETALEISLQAPVVSLAPRQASWMTRADHDRLLDDLPKQSGEGMSEYVLGTLDWIKAQASIYHHEEPLSASSETTQSKEDDPSGRLERVWFWFPSLSSKEKRRDLVDYALEYDLKGFVLADRPPQHHANPHSTPSFPDSQFPIPQTPPHLLPLVSVRLIKVALGKPGLLCLEGDGSKADKYMASIKSQSWSDIPSYQKKVTERLRKPLEASDRKFCDMQDITHLVPQYGQYNHRGDMGEVRRLMEQWGVGDDFGAVVMHVGS